MAVIVFLEYSPIAAFRFSCELYFNRNSPSMVLTGLKKNPVWNKPLFRIFVSLRAKSFGFDLEFWPSIFSQVEFFKLYTNIVDQNIMINCIAIRE